MKGGQHRRAVREREDAWMHVMGSSQAARSGVRPNARKTSGTTAALAPKRVSKPSGPAQWQQIEFRCSSDHPSGSETSFGAVRVPVLAAKRVSE